MTPTTPFSPSIDHTDASSSSFVKTVCLQDWWLIKAENDFDGRRLGIAGLTYREHHPLREFKSAPILKRHDIFTLETVDGVFIMMEGFINRDRTQANGFPSEVFEHFVFGFPSKWEEFARKWCVKEPTHEDASTNQILGRISSDPGEVRSLEDALEKSTSIFREEDISKTQDNLCDLNFSAVNSSRSAGAGQGSLAKKALEDNTFMSNSPKRTLEVENTNYSSPVVAEKDLSAAPEQVDKHKQPSLATITTGKKKKVTVKNSNTKSAELCASKQIFDQLVSPISRKGRKRKIDLDGEANGLSKNSSVKINEFAEKWCGNEPTSEDASTNQILGKISTDPGEIRSLEDASEKSTYREGDISKTQDNLCDLNTSAVNPSRSAGAGQGSLAKKALEDNTFMSNSPKRTLEVENTNYSSSVVAEKDLSAAPEQVDKHKQSSLATNTTGKKKKVTVKNSNTKSVELCASNQIVDQLVSPISRRGSKRKVHLDGEANGLSKISSLKINEFAEKLMCGKEPTNEDASTNQILGRISTDPGEIRSLEDASEKSTSSFKEGDISKTQDSFCDLNTSAVNPSRSAGAGQGSLAKKALEDNTFMSNSPKRTLEVENTNYSSPVVVEKYLSAAPEQVDKHKQPSLAKNTTVKNKKVTVKNSNTKSIELCASKQIVDQPVRPISRRGGKRKVHLDGEASDLSKNSSVKINGTLRSSVRLVEAKGNLDSDTFNKKVKFATNSIRSLKKSKRKLNYESPITPERTFVSPGSSSPKRSRSGRLLIPTMEFWRNQRAIYDASRSIIGVQDNLCEKRFGRGSVSEPPRKGK